MAGKVRSKSAVAVKAARAFALRGGFEEVEMAQKRSAARQLTQENWDDPDVAPQSEELSTAPDHVLADRVIRTAKRRNRNAPEEKRGIFSGFGGFGKTKASPAAPFEFITNLAKACDNGNADAKPKEKPFSFLDKIQSAKRPDAPDRTSPVEKKDAAFASKPAEKVENKNSTENSEYYVNLKSLNLSVSEWIKSHVDKNPYCILTPVFDDYIKHLKELDKLKSADCKEEKPAADTKPVLAKIDEDKNKGITFNFKESPSKDTAGRTSTPTAFSGTPKLDSKSGNASAPFGGLFDKFTSTPMPHTTFGTGEKTKSPGPAASPFSFGALDKMQPKSPAAAPFSFGTAKPFSFGAEKVAPADNFSAKPVDEDESDEPPKVTFTPVVEEDNVYSKRCKVFVKKDDNFGDRGVGTLYVKPIKDSEKYQLIVRADTSLGNLLLNIVLSDSIPTQRMGKNNVMLVCIPNAESTPPPVPTLLRVKSSEEADELLGTLNKYKK